MVILPYYRDNFTITILPLPGSGAVCLDASGETLTRCSPPTPPPALRQKQQFLAGGVADALRPQRPFFSARHVSLQGREAPRVSGA